MQTVETRVKIIKIQVKTSFLINQLSIMKRLSKTILTGYCNREKKSSRAFVKDYAQIECDKYLIFAFCMCYTEAYRHTNFKTLVSF